MGHRNEMINAYLAGFWFAANLVRWRDGVGTDPSAFNYLDQFVSGAGRQNGGTVEEHAAKYADRVSSVLKK